MQIIPVILSGGSGTRLWPLSRQEYPKQYLSLVGNKTMLQETLMRLSGLENILNPIIICNSSHRFIVTEQCRKVEIKNPTILLEPESKNTAPAIVAAAIQTLKHANNPTLLVLSADHIIEDIEAFHKAILIAYNHAQENKLVTFGVLPTNANTGYGYIKLSELQHKDAYEVKEFVEKPDLKTAEFYIAQKNYLWNSGMFMFKSNILINEMRTYSPKIVEIINDSVTNAINDLDFICLDKGSYSNSPNVSIDYALMEKSNNVMVVPLDAGWNDVGSSWSTLYEIGKKDSDNNVKYGDVITKDTSNTYINSVSNMVATIGVDNLIIVNTPDVTFIASKEKSKDIKSIVENLKDNNRDQAIANRKVYRPWGWYDVVEKGKNFQVKRLHVNSGAKLSLQLHYKRAEHWIVVRGIATVINGEKIIKLSEGESTYIPVGTKHSLENKTSEELEIIEVQSGTYLGEDDIVRFEDIYGRLKK